MCTEEGEGGMKGTTFCFCFCFCFVFLYIKNFLHEHVKVFTMIYIYYLSVKVLFENSL